MAISPQQLTISLYSARRAVIFAIAQLSCIISDHPRSGSGLGLMNALNINSLLHLSITYEVLTSPANLNSE